MFVSVSMFAQSPLKKMTKVDVNPLTERTVTKAQTTRISAGMAKAKANAAEKNAPNYYLDYSDYAYNVGFQQDSMWLPMLSLEMTARLLSLTCCTAACFLMQR